MVAILDLTLLAFAALVMVLTPGPNMVYLVSRSVIQGRMAGIISLFGVAVGFLVHMLTASLGLTAIFLAVPYAYAVVKFAGALYLAWLAWQAVKPGGHSPFEAQALPHDAPTKLFRMGFLTNLLNPKAAVFCMSLLPQFVHPERGDAFMQSIVLGVTQISVSFVVNFFIVLSASALAAFFATKPTWLKVQRYVMATVLGGLAVRLAFDRER